MSGDKERMGEKGRKALHEPALYGYRGRERAGRGIEVGSPFSRAKVEITVNVFPRVYKFFVLAAAAIVVVEDKVVVRPCTGRTGVP